MADDDGGLTNALQVIVLSFLSIILLVVVYVFEANSLLSSLKFLSGIAERNGSAVKTLLNSAVAQAAVTLAGAANQVEGIVRDISAAVLAGLQLVLGVVVALGSTFLVTITEGAAAIADVLIDLGQNLATFLTNALTPIKQIAIFVGSSILDVISVLGAAFLPLKALINGQALMVCCVTTALHNFPGLSSIPIEESCPNAPFIGTCNCYCASGVNCCKTFL